ncbi:MAG TPA: methyltransferase domain-containing protein [Chitinophagaceae bacterium]
MANNFMETDSISEIVPEKVHSTVNFNRYDSIKTYYDIAGPDYEVWSHQFNMHFGYIRSFMDVFSLEKMLVNMSDEVINQLQLGKTSAHIADLGCGVGAVARYTAKKYPAVNITGVTISKYQVEKASALNRKDDLHRQISIVNENFEALSFEDESFDHAYALESACHSSGSSKELFIAEMARILKKDGRFCIADGFLKPDAKRPSLFNYLNKKITKFWAVPCFANIDEFERTLKEYDLKDISIREISWKIAPSVMYVPWTCVKFFVKEIWRNKSLRMEKERWNNVYAPVLGMILGLYRKHFGYYIITGKK